MRFECILARMTTYTEMPDFVHRGQTQILEDVFRFSSNNDIELTINDAPMATHRLSAHGVWALDLHEALADLTRNPPPPAPSKRIAVLYADFYKPFKDTLGVMFDRGFDPGDDPSSAAVFRRSPREGCAVFMEAIAQARDTPAKRSTEELFTTIHEMGHVFNLQHTSQRSYMVQGGGLSGANEFIPGHQAMLRSCSTSDNVWPGGKPFSDTGPFANLNRKSPSPSRVSGLSMHIGMEQKEFWPFEPVELDIELKWSKNQPRAISVPHALDPGYETFQIWIEEPSGERRLYRSPRRYCKGNARLTLEPGGSFLRDVSIFGESGGYTFRTSGPHKMWATFEAKQGVHIRSNMLEVNVKGHSDSKLYQEAMTVLKHSARGKFLYYRQAQAVTVGHVRRLKAFVEVSRGLESAGSVRYALAKALAHEQLAQGKTVSQTVVGLLSQAADAKYLGRRQRQVSRALLSRIAENS